MQDPGALIKHRAARGASDEVLRVSPELEASHKIIRETHQVCLALALCFEFLFKPQIDAPAADVTHRALSSASMRSSCACRMCVCAAATSDQRHMPFLSTMTSSSGSATAICVLICDTQMNVSLSQL